MEQRPEISKVRKVRRAKLVPAFLTPEIIVALLGILGTLVGWYVKRWWYNIDKEKEAKELQQKDQVVVDKSTQKAADETARINDSKAKQDAAAKKWFESQ